MTITFINRPMTLSRPVLWVLVFAAAILSLFAFGIVDAQTLNNALDPQAETACKEVKSLTDSRWLKVFLVIGAGVAVANIYRKQKDGWTNLGWVIVAAALLGVLWSALETFGIGC